MYSKFSQNDANVIIIGAGLSGLTTAFYILRREPTLSVMIFEGNDRIGGRIKSERLDVLNNADDDNNTDEFLESSALDLGGQYFLKTQTPIIDLLNDLNIQFEEAKAPGKEPMVATYDKNDYNTSTMRPPLFGNAVQNYELYTFFGELETLAETINYNNMHIDALQDLDNTNMAQYMEKKLFFKFNKDYLKALLKEVHGVDASSISVLYFIAYCNSTYGLANQTNISTETNGKCWIHQGAYAICEKILEQIGERNVYINHPVTKVRNRDGFVLVKTKQIYYKCECAVIAVPPNQILNINFSPPLPADRIKYLKNMTHGKAIKFVATYNEPFWKSNGFSGDIYFLLNESPLLCCFNMETSDKPALYGYINAKFVESFPSDSFQPVVLAELAKYFGKETLQPVNYFEMNWSAEDYCGGSPMSVPGLDFCHYVATLSKPVGSIYWTGSEMSTYWYGHMAGAVRSAYLASFQVLNHLRPQSLTVKELGMLANNGRNFGNNSIWYHFYKDKAQNTYTRAKYLIPVCLTAMLAIYVLNRIFHKPH